MTKGKEQHRQATKNLRPGGSIRDLFIPLVGGHQGPLNGSRFHHHPKKGHKLAELPDLYFMIFGSQGSHFLATFGLPRAFFWDKMWDLVFVGWKC